MTRYVRQLLVRKGWQMRVLYESDSSTRFQLVLKDVFSDRKLSRSQFLGFSFCSSCENYQSGANCKNIAQIRSSVSDLKRGSKVQSIASTSTISTSCIGRTAKQPLYNFECIFFVPFVRLEIFFHTYRLAFLAVSSAFRSASSEIFLC